MSLAYEFLDFTRPQPHIGCLALARPKAANALNTAMAQEIGQFFKALNANLRVLILTGSGERAFCAGADLKERQGMDEAAWEAQHAALRAARDAVWTCPIPTIAAVNGAAFGGGFELALACDFIYAADTARFALPEATLGIMPGMGGTYTLPHAVGARRASEMLFTGQAVSAKDAYDYGLINHLCKASALMHDVLACAEAIAANAPLALQALKSTLRTGGPEVFARELAAYRPLLSSRDRLEGITAFNEKRKAEFTGT